MPGVHWALCPLVLPLFGSIVPSLIFLCAAEWSCRCKHTRQVNLGIKWPPDAALQSHYTDGAVCDGSLFYEGRTPTVCFQKQVPARSLMSSEMSCFLVGWLKTKRERKKDQTKRNYNHLLHPAVGSTEQSQAVLEDRWWGVITEDSLNHQWSLLSPPSACCRRGELHLPRGAVIDYNHWCSIDSSTTTSGSTSPPEPKKSVIRT